MLASIVVEIGSPQVDTDLLRGRRRRRLGSRALEARGDRRWPHIPIFTAHCLSVQGAASHSCVFVTRLGAQASL